MFSSLFFFFGWHYFLPDVLSSLTIPMVCNGTLRWKQFIWYFLGWAWKFWSRSSLVGACTHWLLSYHLWLLKAQLKETEVGLAQACYPPTRIQGYHFKPYSQVLQIIESCDLENKSEPIQISLSEHLGPKSLLVLFQFPHIFIRYT